MKKRVISMLLIATMVVAMLAGCGSKNSNGKVLNIYVWNDEFRVRIEDCYPGYEKTDDPLVGKIGDVKVVWNETPSKDLAYQNNLDATLKNQESAEVDEKIDMFLVEADYAKKYVDTEYTMDIKDLGIKDSDIAEQFQYTKDVMTSADGVIKGLSWQGCPAGLIYNRAIAKEVLGTDDPAKVQEYVKDWATYEKTAATLAAAGYKMTASVNDTYRTYSNNVTSKWVIDGKINIDENIVNWVKQAKRMYDAGQIDGTYDLWGTDWSTGFYVGGKVFCYFGPAWFIDYSMQQDDPNSIAYNGGWGLAAGPQGYYWGGTWICAATGTDNESLVKDIMKMMTCDVDNMINIVKTKNDFVNNKSAMETMAASDYTSAKLGGQNPLSIYLAGIDSIDMSNLTFYDQGCNETFQKALKEYFDGNATYEEAVELFYKSIIEKYPNLTK